MHVCVNAYIEYRVHEYAKIFYSPKNKAGCIWYKELLSLFILLFAQSEFSASLLWRENSSNKEKSRLCNLLNIWLQTDFFFCKIILGGHYQFIWWDRWDRNIWHIQSQLCKYNYYVLYMLDTCHWLCSVLCMSISNKPFKTAIAWQHSILLFYSAHELCPWAKIWGVEFSYIDVKSWELIKIDVRRFQKFDWLSKSTSIVENRAKQISYNIL